MYLTFYGLKEKPFNATPDPRFLYLTPGHREALAQLVYSVQENRGFLVLTGEVGTGKTTLLQAFLGRLDGKAVVAYVPNSTLRFQGMLEYILTELGVEGPAHSPAQRLHALRQFMLERRRAGQNTVLILDEAQNLDVPTLEQIRLLSNFEAQTEKFLQILLVGQPELQAKLARPALRQLRQRIELQCRITPLSREQVHLYIATRLRVAGARDPGLFSERARDRIALLSRGIPRSINILCDHCLVLGYVDQRRRIEADIVEHAYEALRGPARLSVARLHWPRWAAWDRWVLAAVAGAVVAGLAVSPLRFDFMHLLTLARAVFVR